RRHTRSKRDWSSDVCSSDLVSLKPDVNKEWNNFRQSRISGKNKGKQLWIGISIGVAASVLLFFSWQMFDRTSLVPVNQPIVAFKIGRASCREKQVIWGWIWA